MTPTISVLLPVYNGQTHLKQAIDSILNQSYQDFELIIVNDGSTDGTLDLIRSYSDKRIVLINQKNIGLSGALNRAIKESRGRYLARQDHDDVSLPMRFEEQLRLMEAKSLDFCGCNILMIDEAGNPMQRVDMPNTPDLITITMACTVPFAHGSVMMRKAFVAQHSLCYQERSSAEDYELWSEAYRLGAQFGNVDKVLFHYRDFSGSLSKIFTKNIQKHAHQLRRSFVKTNTRAVNDAINDLLPLQNHLKPRFAGFLLLAAYLLYRQSNADVIFKVLLGASLKNVAIAIAKLIRGF